LADALRSSERCEIHTLAQRVVESPDPAPPPPHPTGPPPRAKQGMYAVRGRGGLCGRPLPHHRGKRRRSRLSSGRPWRAILRSCGLDTEIARADWWERAGTNGKHDGKGVALPTSFYAEYSRTGQGPRPVRVGNGEVADTGTLLRERCSWRGDEDGIRPR